MPIDKLEEGAKNFNEWFNVFPLLIFPVRAYDRGNLSGMIHPK